MEGTLCDLKSRADEDREWRHRHDIEHARRGNGSFGSNNNKVTGLLLEIVKLLAVAVVTLAGSRVLPN